MKKTNLKIVLVTIFAALLSGCTWLNTETEGGISRGKLIVGMMAVGAGIAGIVHSDSDSGDTILPTRPTTTPDTTPEVGIATSDSVMEGNAAVAPTALAANAIRNLQSDAIDGVAITASRYDDLSTRLPQVYVQRLEFAALGIWVNGNDPEIGMTDHDDYDYAFLGDNGVNPPSTTDGRGDAIYDVEGDATYRGLNFFPDGSLTMHFDLGTFEGAMSATEGVAETPDDFGGANPAAGTDFFTFSFTNGRITDTGFEVSDISSITGLGFFSGLNSITATSLTGRFYNGPGYNPSTAAPTELAGVVEITNGGGMNDLHIGFLGRIQP